MNSAAGADATFIEVRLVATRYAARDTNLYELRKDDCTLLPAAEPGAHIDIRLPNGIMRQYSLTVPDPHPTSYILGIKRDPASRGGSKFIFDEIKVGQVLNISRPRNNFRLSESAAHTVLFAGGIGVTPIYSMVQHLSAAKKSWELHYACRSRSEAVFLNEFQNLSGVNFHFDDEAPEEFLDLNRIIDDSPEGSHFYCCGPLPMLTAFEDAAKELPSEQVHVEHFTPKEVAKISGAGRRVHLPEGWSPIWKDTPADKAYIILDGTVSVRVDGNEIAQLGAGDIVGEAAIMGHKLRNATIVALTPLDTIHLTDETLLKLDAEMPSFHEALVEVAQSRVS